MTCNDERRYGAKVKLVGILSVKVLAQKLKKVKVVSADDRKLEENMKVWDILSCVGDCEEWSYSSQILLTKTWSYMLTARLW